MVLGRVQLHRLRKKWFLNKSRAPAAKQAAEKIADFICELFLGYCFSPRTLLWTLPGPCPRLEFAASEHTPPRAYTAGISFTIRTRLAAVATNRKSHSTFLTPPIFTSPRILPTSPTPNTSSPTS